LSTTRADLTFAAMMMSQSPRVASVNYACA
jgi:hypothetical protein